MNTALKNLSHTATTAFFTGLTLLSSAGIALAQDAPQDTPKQPVAEKTCSVKGIARMNAKIGLEDGSVKQILPNAVLNAKCSDWTLSGALKIDNLEPDEGFAGNHDTRLFWLNATYSGLKDKTGTTIRLGVIPPAALTEAPLHKGFTPVMLDGKHQLYGGITALEVQQNLITTDKSSLGFNVAVGTKQGLERFGADSDSVVFAGVNGSHKFSDRLSASAEALYIKFDQGSDIYANGTLKYDAGAVDLGLYGEMTQGDRNGISTDKYSVMGTVTGSLSTKTDWQFAAGSIDGDAALEGSLYHQVNKDLRISAGAGYNIDQGAPAARVGFLQTFDLTGG